MLHVGGNMISKDCCWPRNLVLNKFPRGVLIGNVSVSFSDDHGGPRGQPYLSIQSLQGSSFGQLLYLISTSPLSPLVMLMEHPPMLRGTDKCSSLFCRRSIPIAML